MRFIKAITYLAGMGFSLSRDFQTSYLYDQFRSSIPYTVQSLCIWGFGLAALYQIIRGAHELIANAKAKE